MLYYATPACVIYSVLFWDFRNSFEVLSRHVCDFTVVDCTAPMGEKPKSSSTVRTLQEPVRPADPPAVRLLL